jgi:carboxylesterase type B
MGSEDCLYLNVFIPIRETTEPLPVAFHIHAGTFVRGSGDHPLFPHENFTKAGMVTVTVNYRLGMFGFLTLPQLLEESPEAPANWGLLDQRVALEWVQENIALFGGDVNSITALGESAGAASILHQMVYKGGVGKPLFHRAFMSSPPALSGPEYAVENVTKGYLVAASRMGCDPKTTKDVLQCMREIPQESLELMKNRQEVFPYSTSAPAEYLHAGWPVNDHVNFPDVGVALAEGRFWKDVQVIIGADWDEGLSFLTIVTPVSYPTAEFLQHQFQVVYGEAQGKSLWEAYKPNGKTRKTVADSFGDIVGDTLLNCPTWTHARSLAKHSNYNVFRYGNNHIFDGSWAMFGAFHTVSSILFYNNSHAGFPHPPYFTSDEQAVANIMYKVMLDFIRGKEPDHKFWPPFKVGGDQGLVFTAGNLSITVDSHWKSDTCSVWAPLFPPLGLWAPACRADIWADEPLSAHIPNTIIWWCFLNLRAAALIVLGIVVVILGSLIRCCCRSRCCASSTRTAVKLKKE